ncbi:MAG: TetR/AcrR family transcriptional regulator [Ktedonobacterales bacterium]
MAQVEQAQPNTGPGRPSDARRRLLRAAMTLIFSHSYASASVDQLCKQADVGKSSFYHFFESKHDLALATLDHYWGRFKERTLAPAFADEVPPLERVVRLFDLAYEWQSKVRDASGHMVGCFVGNMTLEMATQDDAIRAKVDDIFREWAGYFEQVLRDAMAAGAIPPADPALAAQALLAYLEGVLLLAKGRNDPEIITRLRTGVYFLCRMGGTLPTGA